MLQGAVLLPALAFLQTPVAGADTRPAYQMEGTVAQVAPHMELSGSYEIYFSVHNTPWTSHHKSCLFGATLDGTENPTPAAYVKWGIPIPILDVPFYRRRDIVTFAPGHYQFHIFPSSDCAYKIFVTPWDPDSATGPLTFVAAKMFNEAGNQVSEIDAGTKYDAAIYVGGGVRGASGEIQVVQDGSVRATIPLERSVAEDGGVYFHAWLEGQASGGPVQAGSVTLRFVVNENDAHLTHDFPVTFKR